MRQARSYLVVLGLAVAAAALLAVYLSPVLALAPLVMPGAPAGLLAWATIRHGDPYDVTYKYRDE